MLRALLRWVTTRTGCTVAYFARFRARSASDVTKFARGLESASLTRAEPFPGEGVTAWTCLLRSKQSLLEY